MRVPAQSSCGKALGNRGNYLFFARGEQTVPGGAQNTEGRAPFLFVRRGTRQQAGLDIQPFLLQSRIAIAGISSWPDDCAEFCSLWKTRFWSPAAAASSDLTSSCIGSKMRTARF